MGLAGLVEKIDWFLERSAAKEWIGGEKVHWRLDLTKVKARQEKEGMKIMALTFDDGPNEQTMGLLDKLKEHEVKATFFLVGSLIKGREHIVERIIREGHDVGVHEWAQEGASPKVLLEDPAEYGKRFVGPRRDIGHVKDTYEEIKRVTGVTPSLGRVAGVHGTLDSYGEFQNMGLDIIHGYWKDVLFMSPSAKTSSDELKRQALKGNGNGRIRIFHIGQMLDTGNELREKDVKKEAGEYFPPEETLKMIDDYLAKSKDQRYEFVKVRDYIQ